MIPDRSRRQSSVFPTLVPLPETCCNQWEKSTNHQKKKTVSNFKQGLFDRDASAFWSAPPSHPTPSNFHFHLFLPRHQGCLKQYTIFTPFFGGVMQSFIFCVMPNSLRLGCNAPWDSCLRDTPGCLSISVGTCCIGGPGSWWDAGHWSLVERKGGRGSWVGGCGRDIPSWPVTSLGRGREVGE